MKQKKLLKIIFLISFFGTISSLYVSYFGDPVINLRTRDLRNPLLGIAPCTLCWYVRICLFPLVIISYLALKNHDRNIRKTILPFGVIWFLMSIYIYGLEMNRREKSNELCGLNSLVSCWNPVILYDGRFTLATWGIIWFGIIIWACLSIRKQLK